MRARADVTALVSMIVVSLAACSSSDPSALDEYRSSAKAPTVEVLEVGQRMSDAAQHGDSVALRRECAAALKTIIRDKTALEAAPDPALRSLMTQAMTEFQRGSRECVSGDWSESGLDLQRGEQDLNRASDRLDALTGRSK